MAAIGARYRLSSGAWWWYLPPLSMNTLGEFQPPWQHSLLKMHIILFWEKNVKAKSMGTYEAPTWENLGQELGPYSFSSQKEESQICFPQLFLRDIMDYTLWMSYVRETSINWKHTLHAGAQVQYLMPHGTLSTSRTNPQPQSSE